MYYNMFWKLHILTKSFIKESIGAGLLLNSQIQYHLQYLFQYNW